MKMFLLSSCIAHMSYVTFRQCTVSQIFQQFCVVRVQILKAFPETKFLTYITINSFHLINF
jgi:hypothetical protein